MDDFMVNLALMVIQFREPAGAGNQKIATRGTARERGYKDPMIQLRTMADADLPFGSRLSREAGWNQTEADWRRAIDLQPDGCFVAEWEGMPAGTATTCVFGDVAWIAMVLVDERLRRRGIGTGLMRHALTFLDEGGVSTVRLDATPLGQPLYEQLGFVAEYRLARFEGVLEAAPGVAGVATAIPEQWQALVALDQAVTGADRSALLFHAFAAQPDSVRVTMDGETASGFIAARDGYRAVHLGPCIAPPDLSPLLLIDAWGRYPGRRVFIDIPIDNITATREAAAQGLTAQRYLTRMRRGTPRLERLDWLAASFGPEKG
jgi:GNAT superfamily N-acetyltransferase